MSELKKGDKIKIGELETQVDGFTTITGQKLVSTPYGDFAPELVKKVEEPEYTFENGLTYAKGYHDYDINDFVGIVPCRELEPNEELDGICQIKDESTGFWHVGFVVKRDGNSKWIGSRTTGQTYKVVSRNAVTKQQVKKRIYTSIEDYNRYSRDLIKRYSMYHEVEVYMLVGHKHWQLIKTILARDWDYVKQEKKK